MANLPDRGWSNYEGALRRLGERRPEPKDTPALRFLGELGFVTSDLTALTDRGNAYFDSAFIRDDRPTAVSLLTEGLRSYPPSIAISQLLWGVAGATKTTVETVLRSQGFADGLTERSLGSLLMLLRAGGLVEYTKSSGEVRVLKSLLDSTAPLADSAFVSPKTPFGNKVWLSRVIRDCTGSVRWLDKHFMPAAFELVWEAADANRISTVRILSLLMSDHSGRRPLRPYRDLRTELANRGIKLEWRTIDSKLMRDTHDRWVIGENEAWNIPNVNAVYTGQNSEMHRTDAVSELATIFDEYWAQATEFDQGSGD